MVVSVDERWSKFASSAAERGGGNCPGAHKKLKLFSSVICCNDIRVKFRRGPVSISCPRAFGAFGGVASLSVLPAANPSVLRPALGMYFIVSLTLTPRSTFKCPFSDSY